MPHNKYLLYLTEDDVRKTLTIEEAIDLARKGIEADAQHLVGGNKFYMQVDRQGFVKPFSGYLEGEEYFFVKTFSYFPHNPEDFGCATTSSMVLLFDAESGFPVSIMEASWVTGVKTAASTAVTATYLARRDSNRLMVFGAGSLGQNHVRAMSSCFSLREIYLVDIIQSAAETRALELSAELNLPVIAVPYGERDRYVRQSDMIITVTTGVLPLFSYEWIKKGAFVARLGSYQEVELDVITRADKVIVDNWVYVSPRIPELIDLGKTGQFGFEDVHAEWADVVGNRRTGRETEDEIIVYIALGVWGEYAAILPEVYRKALALGIGQKLSLSGLPKDVI